MDRSAVSSSSSAAAAATAAAASCPAVVCDKPVHDKAGGRVRALLRQLSSSSSACSSTSLASRVDPSTDLRWNGWGYADTSFSINDNGHVVLSGSRYEFSGSELPAFKPFMLSRGVDVTRKTTAASLEDIEVASPRPDNGLIAALPTDVIVSQDKLERIRHSHGHSLQEIYALRNTGLLRYVDSVVYPMSREHVEAIVAKCFELDVAIIPFGGGTSVTHALVCPENETRHIVSLDMSKMCRIKWVNATNMTAMIEAGAIGLHIEAQLRDRGFCLGHEPDSHEFSSLGGWIATRASGMKKSAYGNIEDIVQQITLVSATGVVQKTTRSPRESCGPSIQEMVLGSEGVFGVVTDAVVRIRRLPEAVDYGTLIFPDFESGIGFMHELALQRGAKPVSVRLVDNEQFLFSLAIKPEDKSWSFPIQEKFKKWYVERHLGFEMDKITAATLMFEGDKCEVAAQKKAVYALAGRFSGYYGGREAGRRGYFLTFMIAYIRDFALDYCMLGESFETAVEWKNVLPLCNQVKHRIHRACEQRGIQEAPFVSCRITQIYDTGACIYFYFAILSYGLTDAQRVFSEIEDEARSEVLACGGNLSHHHGVGKLRKNFMPQVLSNTSLRMLQALKRELDPTNVFAARNLIDIE